jgi:hypothetical protein
LGRVPFPSKVDWWLGVVLTAGVFAGPLLQALLGGTDLTLLGVSTLVGAFILSLIFPTDYTVNPDAVLIRSGWIIRWQIPLAEIRRIEPSRSWESGPALSLDRLRVVRERGRDILISPADQEGFLRAVALHAPHLALSGRLLVPR